MDLTMRWRATSGASRCGMPPNTAQGESSDTCLADLDMERISFGRGGGGFLFGRCLKRLDSPNKCASPSHENNTLDYMAYIPRLKASPAGNYLAIIEAIEQTACELKRSAAIKKQTIYPFNEQSPTSHHHHHLLDVRGKHARVPCSQFCVFTTVSRQ